MAGESLLAAAKLLSKPLEDLYSLGKEKAGSRLLRWRQAKHINSLYKKIDAVQKIKTIWQIDKEVKLMTFYYPLKVQINNKATPITDIRELGPSGNCVIQGIVGQGKSIFLRYLCIRELALGKRIPIFFELRRIERTQTLRSHIDGVLKTYGFEINDDLFDFYASSGKFVFLLDAFDELDSELVSGVVNELELLAQQYPNLQIIITSRPDSGIERSAHFRVFPLSLLTPEDHRPFLEKIVPESDRVRDLLKAIKGSSAQIHELLRTPLMLTLLVLVYKAEQTIPSALSEFYENLFQTLLTRHDKSKPGYSRKRHCELTDRQIKTIFEGFCFVARQKGYLVLTEEQLSECLGTASKFTGLKCDEKGFAQDITKVTCLMQEEAFRYHFIHKSVLEFHAASFVRHSHNDMAVKFYAKLQAGAWRNWHQELVFLSQIDTYRFTKYFLIPSLHDTFKELAVSSDQSPAELTQEQVFQLLEKNQVAFTTETPSVSPTMAPAAPGTAPMLSSITLSHDTLGVRGYSLTQFEMNYVSQLFQLANPALNASPRFPAMLQQRTQGGLRNTFMVGLGTWLRDADLLDRGSILVNQSFALLKNSLRDAEAFIALEESKEDLLSA